MTEREAALYASAVAKVIHARGELPRGRALAMLRALDLDDDQAGRMIAHGLTLGLFVEEPATATLRTPRQVPVEIHDERVVQGERVPTALEAERRIEILRLILQSLPIVMWVMDAQGIFLHFEGQGVQRMGLTEGQFVGQNFFELFAQHESAAYVHRALAGESTHSLTEFAGIHWQNWCFPIPEPDGRTKLIVFISIDVTDSKRKERELLDQLDLIERQQRMIRALSTPIIEVWDKVLTLPLFGVLDSRRSAEVMDNLLSRVSATGARFAILDLTSVEGMDTLTASHILQLIRALRLLGTEGIITGIQPDVARAMVALDVGLEGIVTLSSLRSALQFCMRAMSRDALRPRG